MGKTGELGPPPSMDGDGQAQWHPALSQRLPGQTIVVSGSDLYRFDCRGCHGEAGLGAPPEIRSVINPVRATSAVLVSERMKSTGMDISHAQAAQMASQARLALSERFQKGGESMPPFSHLREAEVRSLTEYLDALASVPGARQASLQESPLRVGELVVKSTCHICHDATGANPTPEQILEGAIPPLSTLTARTNEAEFIRKVTHGAPIRMGEPVMLQRGRMPVFYYLSEDEAAAIYSYLTRYPPSSAQDNSLSPIPTQGLIALVTATDSVPAAMRPPTEEVDATSVVLMVALGALVVLLVIAGFAITVREFSRLTSRAESQAAAPKPTPQPQAMQAYSTK